MVALSPVIGDEKQEFPYGRNAILRGIEGLH
jgi:hypothetical protein